MDGHPTTDKCPECGGQLIKNNVGSEWCISLGCSYFVHRGALVLASRMKELNERYAYLIPEKVVQRGKQYRTR